MTIINTYVCACNQIHSLTVNTIVYHVDQFEWSATNCVDGRVNDKIYCTRKSERFGNVFVWLNILDKNINTHEKAHTK